MWTHCIPGKSSHEWPLKSNYWSSLPPVTGCIGGRSWWPLRRLTPNSSSSRLASITPNSLHPHQRTSSPPLTFIFSWPIDTTTLLTLPRPGVCPLCLGYLQSRGGGHYSKVLPAGWILGQFLISSWIALRLSAIWFSFYSAVTSFNKKKAAFQNKSAVMICRSASSKDNTLAKVWKTGHF